MIAVTEPYAAHADCVTTHAAHVVLVKADGHAAVGGDEYLLRAVGLQNGHQLVALVERERTDAV